MSAPETRPGRLFTPSDRLDLARTVDWLLTHPDERAAMRTAARREYEAQYTSERNYDQLMTIYRRVLDERTAVTAGRAMRVG